MSRHLILWHFDDEEEVFPIVTVEKVNDVLVTTSNRVAEELGVNHRHLLDKIDDYLSKFQSAKFRQVSISQVNTRM